MAWTGESLEKRTNSRKYYYASGFTPSYRECEYNLLGGQACRPWTVLSVYHYGGYSIQKLR